MDRNKLPELTQKHLSEILDKPVESLNESNIAFLYARRDYLTEKEEAQYVELFSWYEEKQEAKVAKEQAELKSVGRKEDVSSPVLEMIRAQKEEFVQEKAKKGAKN